MSDKLEIRTQFREDCLVCHSKGASLYKNLHDQLFDAPGKWDLTSCPNCGLVWLNPYPIAEDVGKLYSAYYTHQNIKRGFLGNLSERLKQGVHKSMGYKSNLSSLSFGNLIPFFRSYAALDILNVKANWGKRLLDVGSGNGEYLNIMRNYGWEVEGLEIDNKAADFARDKYNLKVHTKSLFESGIPSESFDVITLNHVIEHVYEAEQLLAECKRILKPGGRVILLTPNRESLGFKLFGKDWRGLEIPRHMSVFSVSNMGILAQRVGFKSETLTSTARISRYLYSTSVHIRQGREKIGGGGNRGYWLALKSYVFQLVEELVMIFNKKAGEEIFFVGVKN